MARNDKFFLERWISYYGAELGEENLFVFLDGADQEIPGNAGKVNITICDHIPQKRTVADKTRITRLSELATKLLDEYDLVIGTDADEFLVVDPHCNQSLKEYLSTVNCSPSVSGLGIDVGQKLGVENKIDSHVSLLSQRGYAVASSRYTKPVVISRPVSWGSGFHRVKNCNFRIDKNLYLFHLGYFDIEMIQQKSQDKDRINTGWNKHLKKRAKTILLTTNKKAFDGDVFLPVARIIQTLVRPVYAWNKPTMGCWKLVVKIPERFRNINI